jgi:shikimate dehydrogenase
MLYSALIGHPVGHSVSPVLFNYLAKQVNLEYSHLKIDLSTKNKLKSGLKSLSELEFCGINVTLPYKLDIMKYLNSINREAKKIGAVNTITFKKGKIIGHNTDAEGALMAIEFKLKPINSDDRVLILGSGGAARAIAFALYQKTKKIIIVSRNVSEAKILSFDISQGKIVYKKLTDYNIKEQLELATVVINATPIGMHPDKGEIINRSIWKKVNVKNKVFFDAIFNPYMTSFLKMAESNGARVCSGMYMMIFQAITAFSLWTGAKLSNIKIEEINDILKKTLLD